MDMERAFVMLNAALKELLKGNSDLAAAPAVQNMKALHQFSTDGTWKAAWPLTFLADSWTRYWDGGTEAEVETAA